MITPEMVGLVREEVRKQLNIILHGAAGANDAVETETINSIYPGAPAIADRPVMHPYGFASRAPSGTISVVARVGEGPQNKMTIGHRDKGRKALSLKEGDSIVYSSAAGVPLATITLSGDTITITNQTKASITIGQDGSIIAKDVAGGELALKNGLVALGNSAGEVVDILNEVVMQLSTCTAAGFGAPISIVAAMTPLIAKLALMKGTL